MADIFVSHKKDDFQIADRFVSCLRAEGFNVWWDDSLTPKDAWDATIEHQLALASVVVVLWTARSVNSDWVRTEAHYGQDRGKLVPVMMEACTISIRLSVEADRRPVQLARCTRPPPVAQTFDLDRRPYFHEAWQCEYPQSAWRGATQPVSGSDRPFAVRRSCCGRRSRELLNAGWDCIPGRRENADHEESCPVELSCWDRRPAIRIAQLWKGRKNGSRYQRHSRSASSRSFATSIRRLWVSSRLSLIRPSPSLARSLAGPSRPLRRLPSASIPWRRRRLPLFPLTTP